MLFNVRVKVDKYCALHNAISLWVSERGRHGGRDITFTLVLRFLPYIAIPNTAHAAPSIDSVS